ncbi:GNAT family N-acetyltransferase [Microbispora sp. ATCC PTA-5024]|uniref:GNAT family N-acetyltransferase n=1 Tax=Microbispora sp. ATCC PTA-5024 TaxID=316330 RepID=UPI0003DCCA29|nr:GNAT family N-acetyltransferase [Microbispora sp. ATCC PTA-5024]ETK31116.1 acetyltransferase [Microbispora sp. ATCC PTA-5024]
MSEIADNPGKSRYEITVDGRLAGFAQYKLRGDTIVFTHTEIGEEFEGKGLGSALVRTALDGARDAGLTVAPLCPFVSAYIKRHQEYADLVGDAYRSEVTD